MTFLSKENPDRWYHLAWWLCVVTLPWADMANNIGMVVLAIAWSAKGGFAEKWIQLKETKWVWPFFTYYLVLVAGLLITPDLDNGFFTLEKKLSFVAYPLIAATGKPLGGEMVSFLKRSFVYSCTAVIFLCLIAASANYFQNGSAFNFDFSSAANYQQMHPDAAPFWMHFSYISLVKWAGLHATYFSMYLVFCLVILFTEKYSTRNQLVAHVVLAVLIGVFVALLSTRIAVIALVISMGYLCVKRIIEKKATATLPIFIVAIILVGMVWYNPVSRFRLIEEPTKTMYQADQTMTNWNSVNFRLLEWRGSWSIIKDHFVLGVGTGGWQVAMSRFYASFNASTVGLVHNAHNQFLQIWMENGLPGLIAFLACVFGFVFRANHVETYVLFIVIFSVMCLTESIGERQKGIVFFTFFQSLFLAFEIKLK